MSNGEQSPDPDASRLRSVLTEEFGSLHTRVRLMRRLSLLIPRGTGFRLRTQALRMTGWKIPRSTMFSEVPQWSGSGPIRTRLTIGEHGWINVGCHFELNDHIIIGDHCSLGHEVLIMTSTHRVGSRGSRAGALFTAPVSIGAGAWIGARSTIFPGVTVGRGAIVSAGSVVTTDVPDNSVVAGAPASIVVKRLPG
ncbi:acyltransferase [Ilumatobacter coccineus]|uniref:Putative sugar acetyltransferase n=1 Tax=Ilumatobacter coccineus (strain NBRC 103263 / KCTC 29153 / YM16-304) TaxID=1313172 RepID=A0A6C7E5N4_ILUCY|nr:acyltransferase [Ilumatobacter coccineus]BAN01773.1 putative sugar acetyltransferase [Ilumatobacter coccineus YM16-304]